MQTSTNGPSQDGSPTEVSMWYRFGNLLRRNPIPLVILVWVIGWLFWAAWGQRPLITKPLPVPTGVTTNKGSSPVTRPATTVKARPVIDLTPRVNALEKRVDRLEKRPVKKANLPPPPKAVSPPAKPITAPVPKGAGEPWIKFNPDWPPPWFNPQAE